MKNSTCSHQEPGKIVSESKIEFCGETVVNGGRYNIGRLINRDPVKATIGIEYAGWVQNEHLEVGVRGFYQSGDGGLTISTS